NLQEMDWGRKSYPEPRPSLFRGGQWQRARCLARLLRLRPKRQSGIGRPWLECPRELHRMLIGQPRRRKPDLAKLKSWRYRQVMFWSSYISLFCFDFDGLKLPLILYFL